MRIFLEVAAEILLALDRLEQSFEISLTEAAAALTLDHFVEQRGAVFYTLGEDLKLILFFIAIDKNTKGGEFGDSFVDFADAGG